jgi:Putative MetA-pathway of phenol degradation
MKHDRLKTILVVVVAILAVARTTCAGPPYVTDDPEPVDYQHWEFYVASISSKSSDDWSGTAPHFEINYGVIPNVQLHLIIPLGYDVPSTGASHYGLADIELGTKIRFLQEANWIPEAAIFPLLEVPTGNASDNLGNSKWTAYFPLWMQKTWDTWTVYGGGGYGINSASGNQNWGFVGAVLQKQVLSDLAIGAEVYHQTVSEPDFPNQGTAFNVGAIYDFNDHHHLLFSAGRSFSGPVDFQCYIAYQFTFDNSLFHFWSHSAPAKNNLSERH